MTLPWMIPLALLIGVSGTRTALRLRRSPKSGTSDWWLLLVLGWVPLVIWALAQAIGQY
jgi:hypothetical protein